MDFLQVVKWYKFVAKSLLENGNLKLMANVHATPKVKGGAY